MDEVTVPESDKVMDYMDFIESMFDNVPDKRTTEYQTWKKTINQAIEKVNSMAGKIYNLV